MSSNSNQLSCGLPVGGQMCAYIPDTHTDWWVDWLLSLRGGEAGLAAIALDFVHDWFSYLHISYHAVTSSVATSFFKIPSASPTSPCISLSLVSWRRPIARATWWRLTGLTAWLSERLKWSTRWADSEQFYVLLVLEKATLFSSEIWSCRTFVFLRGQIQLNFIIPRLIDGHRQDKWHWMKYLDQLLPICSKTWLSCVTWSVLSSGGFQQKYLMINNN